MARRRLAKSSKAAGVNVRVLSRQYSSRQSITRHTSHIFIGVRGGFGGAISFALAIQQTIITLQGHRRSDSQGLGGPCARR